MDTEGSCFKNQERFIALVSKNLLKIFLSSGHTILFMSLLLLAITQLFTIVNACHC